MAPKKKKAKTKTTEQLAAEAALAAEESAKQAAAASEALRAVIAAELEYSIKNVAKLQTHWLTIMRQAKTEQLRAEAVVLADISSHLLTRKEDLIQGLEEEVEAADKEREQLVASHAAGLEKLLALQAERLKSRQQAFLAELQAMAEAVGQERDEAEAGHSQHMGQLADVQAAMLKHQAALREAAKARFEAMREDTKNQASEEYNVTKLSMQFRVQELEKALLQHHQAYLATDGKRSQIVATMTAEDSEAAAAIDARTRKIGRLAGSIASWRSALNANVREWEQRNTALAAEKNRLAHQHRALKAASQRMAGRQMANLKRLCLASALEEEGLLQRVQVGERVRRLAAMCWKLERQLSITYLASAGPLKTTSEGPLSDSGLATQPAEAVHCAPLQLPVADVGALHEHADPDQVTASAAFDAKVAGVAGGEDTSEVLETCLLSLTLRKDKVREQLRALQSQKTKSLNEHKTWRSNMQQLLSGGSVPQITPPLEAAAVKNATGRLAWMGRSAGRHETWGAGFMAALA